MNTMIDHPDSALYYLAESNQTLDQVVWKIYQHPNDRTIKHFKHVNSHIKNNRVLAGEMLIITPYNASTCQPWEHVLAERANAHNQQIALLNIQERKLLAEYYNLIQLAASNTGAMYGWTTNYFMQRKRHVEKHLKKVQALYTHTLQQYGELHKSPSFFSRRQQLFLQLDNGLRGMLRKQLFGSQSQYLKVKTQLGLNTKAITGQWKAGGADNIKAFTQQTQRMIKVTKQIKTVGYAAIALDIGQGVATIHQACTVQPGQFSVDNAHCEQTSFEQTGRVAGSIWLGSTGGALAYGACNLVFGVPSAGTSLLWCGIVAGGIGGYVGSQAGGHFGTQAGSFLYRKKINLM